MQKCVNLVDLVKSSQTSICLQNLASIQPRTGLSKFSKIIQKLEKSQKIIDPLIPKDMFRLVCLVKLVFFAREGVAF